MRDPFSSAFQMVFVEIPVAAFRITGYAFVFLVQVFLYLRSGRPDRIADAVGYLGRGVTDTMANLMRRMF